MIMVEREREFRLIAKKVWIHVKAYSIRLNFSLEECGGSDVEYHARIQRGGGAGGTDSPEKITKI